MNYETRRLLAALSAKEKAALRAVLAGESEKDAALALAAAFAPSADFRSLLWGRIYTGAIADWLAAVDWAAVVRAVR